MKLKDIFKRKRRRKGRTGPEFKVPPDFALVDVETANTGQDSICQIGVCHVEAGSIADTWTTLVDPQSLFANRLMRIHGISQDKVAGAPTWPDVYPEVQKRLAGLVVSHGAFDKAAVQKTCARYGLEQLKFREWRDSTTLVRRTWPNQFGKSGYALADLAHVFGLEFQHHDALDDAICAAKIVLKAFEAGATMELWRHGRSGRRG